MASKIIPQVSAGAPTSTARTAYTPLLASITASLQAHSGSIDPVS